MTVAKNKFTAHMGQCREALEIYDFLRKSGYHADFGLRFVWVAAVSALDHYISELIVEKATEHFSNSVPLSPKILNEAIPFASMLQMQAAPPAAAVIEFRKIVIQVVRFRTFQKADDVSDGLSYIWSEAHKWNKIAELLGLQNKSAKYKLNSIVYRRDAIVHNADYDESSGDLRSCEFSHAQEASEYIVRVVQAIDELVP